MIDGREAPVQWLGAPAMLDGDEPLDEALFREPSPALLRTLINASLDPLNRWRTRLLGDHLRAPRLSVIDRHATIFDDPAIEDAPQPASATRARPIANLEIILLLCRLLFCRKLPPFGRFGHKSCAFFQRMRNI